MFWGSEEGHNQDILYDSDKDASMDDHLHDVFDERIRTVGNMSIYFDDSGWRRPHERISDLQDQRYKQRAAVAKISVRAANPFCKPKNS
jgi:hypothetical protein